MYTEQERKEINMFGMTVANMRLSAALQVDSFKDPKQVGRFIMSLLSDSQEMYRMSRVREANELINCAKYFASILGDKEP